MPAEAVRGPERAIDKLLLADNPSQFLEQITALDGVSRHQGEVLRTAAVAEQRLAQDKIAAAQQP